MRFSKDINNKYTRSVENAFDAILAKGNAEHRQVAEAILASDMLLRVRPVAEINASGITGVINSVKTNMRLATRRFNLVEALGEIYIAIAEETIDGGGQRGCEGTLIHEGRHAYDFALTLASLSNADRHPLSVFDPSLFDLEYAAHKTSGDWMLAVGASDYTDEGLGLMILCNNETGGCEVSDEGIRRRLNESYGLAADGNVGPTASQMMGLI